MKRNYKLATIHIAVFAVLSGLAFITFGEFVAGANARNGNPVEAKRIVDTDRDRVNDAEKRLKCDAKGQLIGTAECDKILFNSTRNAALNDYDLVLMNTDGTQRTGLLPSNISGGSPEVSQDGTRIVFRRIYPDGGDLDDLYIMNTDGTGITPVTQNRPVYGTFDLRPDGSKAVFEGGSDGGKIFTINTDGSGLTQLTPNDQVDSWPVFSPDGTKIVFVRRIVVSGQIVGEELFSKNVDGTNLTLLTSTGRVKSRPLFSPNGSKILFISRSIGGSILSLEIINSDGSNRMTLAEGLYNQIPRFSPDSSKVVFNPSNTIAEFASINTDGTSFTLITPGNSPDYTLNGDKIVYQWYFPVTSQTADIVIVNSNGTDPVVLTDQPTDDFAPRAVFIDTDADTVGQGCDNCPAIANADQANADNDSLGDACDLDDDNDGVADASDNCPLDVNPDQLNTDGDSQGNVCDADDDNDSVPDTADNCPLAVNYYRVVFSNEFYIWSNNEDGSNRTRLTFGPTTYREIEPEFNRAGSRIVFQSNRSDNRNEIYAMNADGTNQTRLTNVAGNNQSPTYSPDGTKIAFMSGRTRPGGANSLGLYIMNADGTDQVNLATNSLSFGDDDPTFNHDGTRIAYYSGRDLGSLKQDIYAINPDGTNETRLTTATGVDNQPAYSRDGSKIAFISFRGGDTDGEVYIMNADGTNQTRLTNNTMPERHPTFTPDGSKISFSVFNNSTDTNLWRINVDGTGLVRLTNGGSFPYTHPTYAKQADADGDGTGDACDDDFDVATSTGSDVTVQAANASVNFSGVSTGGTTSFAPITPAPGDVPTGYTLCPNCPAYNITTTASYTPPVTVCLGVPASVNASDFLRLRVLHGENGVLVDRTLGRITNPDSSRVVCGRVSSLSPFAMAYALAPTASSVSVGGRVTTAAGYGIRNVAVTLMSSSGVPLTARTSSFGYYQFDNVPVGESYVVSVSTKSHTFAQPSILISVNDELSDVDFVANPLE